MSRIPPSRPVPPTPKPSAESVVQGRWRRLLIGLGIALAAALVLACAGWLYEQAAMARAHTHHLPPGRMIEVNGHRMQLECRGHGAPAVVLEAGLDLHGALAWAPLFDALAAISTVCAYSRAGIMWSEPAAQPYSASDIARDLQLLLQRAHVSAPYVLVAHSLGGPYAMVFAQQFGQDLAGLVWVDPSHPDQHRVWDEIFGDSLRQATAAPSRFMHLLSHLGLVTWLAGRQQPLAGLTPGQSQAVAAYASRSLRAANHEMAQIDNTLAQARQLRSLGHRPLVVLSAGEPDPQFITTLGATVEQLQSWQAQWERLHAQLAALSTRGQHRVVKGAGHYIQRDQPQAVVQAVTDVLAQLRMSQAQAKGL